MARQLGIDHRVIDLKSTFWRQVVEPFIEAYAWGRTPNPCVWCNPLVKFGAALALADELGGAQVASGHYARVDRDPGGPALLRRAADASRDQTYFLYRLPPAVLGRCRFPLGGLTKEQVREQARELGLSVADRPDSQEICFIPAGGLVPFLRFHLPTCSLKPGAIRTRQGVVLGHHDGIHAFTVGQRKGLRVAAGTPLYVLSLDPATGTVVVGDDRELWGTTMRLADVRWAVPPEGREAIPALVRIRCRHREAPARIWPEGSRATVIFDQPQRAITPGQSAVLYEGDRVIGGGIIEA